MEGRGTRKKAKQEQPRRRSKIQLLQLAHLPKPKKRFSFHKRRHVKHLPIETLSSFHDDLSTGTSSSVNTTTPRTGSHSHDDAIPWRGWTETAQAKAANLSTVSSNSGNTNQQHHLSDDEAPVLTLSPKHKDRYQYVPESVTKIRLYTEHDHNDSDEPGDNLQQSIVLWMDHAQQLMQSQEVENLVQSSSLVLHHSARVCVRTVTWPIVAPVQVTTSTIGCMLNTCTQLLLEDKNGDTEHNQGLLWGVIQFPGAVLELTTKLVVGAIAPHLLKQEDPSQRRPQPKKLEYDPAPRRYPHNTDYLDRLRIDSLDELLAKQNKAPKKVENVDISTNNSSIAKKLRSDNDGALLATKLPPLPIVQNPADTSKYLLRVNDLDIQLPEGSVYYVDLFQTDRDPQLVDDALTGLVQGAFSMLANHPQASLRNTSFATTRHSEIVWNPEGGTKKHLRKWIDLTQADQVQYMLDESLIWSGKFRYDNDQHGRKHAFYLARGSIPLSPRELMELLWDNTRTQSYNNFCLGRSTLLDISKDADASILNRSTRQATKVIKSEMRVPFAGITVKAVCLMHVVPLEGPDAGYALLSRSLDCGSSGTHLFGSQHRVDRTKNEILWGCNVLRTVPGHPNVTDLVSLSQVGSNVPGFLAQKIGLLGISDFFKNVRNVAMKNKNKA